MLQSLNSSRSEGVRILQLNEVHLRNWRSYRNATFQLPSPRKKSNVILVGAQNGTGKTSLLIALYMGLFGRQAMHLIEGVGLASQHDEKNRSYRRLLERTIHRPALSADDPHMRIRLNFETDKGEFIIRRTWHYGRNGQPRDLANRDGEEVIVEAGGRPKSFPNWEDANAVIAEALFPDNVMPCFFFDGEQAQARVEATGGRALLDAVNTL